MERLNDVYSNGLNTDNDVIIRVINTILNVEKGPVPQPSIIMAKFEYFTSLLAKLYTSSPISRSGISYIISELAEPDKLKTNWDMFVQMVKRNNGMDKSEYKYIYIMCYSRALFETIYSNNIAYSEPSYAINEAIGSSSWEVFLSAIGSQ